jgi:transcriptional regulator with XRE-family HTH domain
VTWFITRSESRKLTSKSKKSKKSESKRLSRFIEMAELLRDKRVKLEISQFALAKSMGFTSAQFVSNWERAVSSPPLSSLPKICHLLKIKESDMIAAFLKSTKTEIEDAFKSSKRRS